MRDGQNTRFGLGTFSLSDQKPFVGVVLNGEAVVPTEALAVLAAAPGEQLVGWRDTLTLLEHWETNFPVLQAMVNRASGGSSATRAPGEAAPPSHPLRSLRAHPPVLARQIFLSGANYFKHVVDMIVDLGPGKTPGTANMDPATLRTFAEELMTRRRHEGSPYMFTKPVSVLSGAFDPIIIPPDAKQPDWEVELAVVMGRAAHRVSRSSALQHVAGYMVVNDITDRGHIWVQGDMKVMGTDWLTSKCRPTYLPCGPYFVPAAFVPDPQNLQIQLRLNDELMQADSTADMIFDVARLIEHVSNLLVLQPGDIICTGSPAGNGTHFNRYLQQGDVVAASVSGLGAQRTPVIDQRNATR